MCIVAHSTGFDSILFLVAAGGPRYEIMMTIQEHPFLQDVPGVREHFWNMFIMDALIGNTDRNNSNWGIIVCIMGLKPSPLGETFR